MPDSPSEPNPSGLDRAELRDAALSGVRWITVARVILETFAFGASVVVARLVSPAEFGHVAVAAFFFVLAQGLAFGSFGSPLVYARELRTRAVQTASALSLASGAAVSALVFCGAPLLEGAWGSETVDLVQLAGLTFLIYGFGAVSSALLQRRLDFRMLAINEVASLFPGTLVTVGCAAAGLGGLSLVVGYLTTATLSSILAIAAAPPGLPSLHRGEAREILGFGLPTSGASLLYVAQRNVQLAILGARFSPGQLGFFWRGAQLGIDYQGKVSGILLRIAFPLFSRSKTHDDLRVVRGRMVQLHTTLLFPLLTALIVLAPTLVPWLYGERWAPAVEPAQILAVAGFAAVVGTGTGPLMMAVGRPRALLAFNAGSLVVTSVAVYVAAAQGLIAVCLTVVGLRLVSLLVSQYFLVERLAGIPLRETLVRDVAPAVAGSLALAAVALGVSNGLEALGSPSVVVLGLAGVLGLAAHSLTVRALWPAAWRDLRTLTKRVLPKRRRRAAEVAVEAGG
jgi:lipopolysaccharide exporter